MKILYIMSSYNLFGGTPKKTLDLMKHFKERSVLYVYHDAFPQFKTQFEATGGNVYEGFYGRNLFLHVKSLLSIIDNEQIDVVQTQFTMGETLGALIKFFRPKVKFVVAFVGPFKPLSLKVFLLNLCYRNTNCFVYISQYVKNEKIKQFSVLKKKKGIIIFNGTKSLINNGDIIPLMKHFSLFDVAGLADWKNINILIEAIHIIVNKRGVKNVFLYVAGDGPMRNELVELIDRYSLQEHVNLLGYQSNIGGLLENCDVFVHPAYAEGFGIVIPEAMLAKKPIIVANAGALPELIQNEETGLVVDAHNQEAWAEAIITLMENKELAGALSRNAKQKAEADFSIQKFVKNYENLYYELIDKSNAE